MKPERCIFHSSSQLLASRGEAGGGMQDAEHLADPKPFGAADPRSSSGGPLWSRLGFFLVQAAFFFGTQELAGSSPPPAAVSSRDRSHIISLLTINKAVGCRELLRDRNAV